MRGLILKDWYMTQKYCRSYLLIAVVFLVVAFAGEDNIFFAMYPCILCGMIPVNLLAYDERSRWQQYCGTLPYTEGQIVSGKYVVGLMAQVVMLLVTAVTQALRMNLNHTFQWKYFVEFLLIAFILSLVASSIILPFVFRFGVEKGRIVYFVLLGVMGGGSFIALDVLQGNMMNPIPMNGVVPILCLVGIGIYALSWCLSVVLYKKRELQ